MSASDYTQTLIEFLRGWGEFSPASVVVLALIFIASGLVPLPRPVVSVASGVVFGLPVVSVAMPSTTLGALLAFFLARHLLAERVWRWVKPKPKLLAVMNAIDAEGWRIIALCRLASPFPGFVLNLICGLTRIDTWTFTWVTFVFTAPQIVLYSYLGAVGKAALVGESGGLNLALLVASGGVAVAVVLMITRRVRANMRDAKISSRPSALLVKTPVKM